MTNEELIKSKASEELAELFGSLKIKCRNCPVRQSMVFCSTFSSCKDAWLAYLKLEAEVDTGSEQREYEAAVENVEYCERYEPSYEADTGAL